MHRYTESGLANVWLLDGFQEIDTPYGKAVSVDDVDGLHVALALHVTNKPGRLTGKELRFLRCQLNLSQRALGALVDLALRSEQEVAGWERSGQVPERVDAAVRNLVRDKLADPRKTPINPRTGLVWRLSDPEMKDRVDAFRREVSSSPEAAGAFLKRAGILTAAGKLSKTFGG